MRQIIVIFAVNALLQSSSALCGDWHVGNSLRCGDCHLQHSSVQGQLFPGPYTYILKKSGVNEMCLSCHDGTDATAPDVMVPVSMYDGTTAGESAGGSMLNTGIANEAGHALGVATIVPLQAASQSLELSCATCHDVHGNSNYRNLILDPAGTGANIGVVSQTDVLTQVSPDDPPSVAGSVAAYNRGNVAYVSLQLDAWCSACHNQVALNSPAMPPAHFNGHPSGVALNAYGATRHTDLDHWVSGVGEGFATGSVLTGIVRLPFVSTQPANFVEATTARASDQVSCVSCHQAHGAGHRKALRWPYLDGGNQFLAGCQQCHNK